MRVFSRCSLALAMCVGALVTSAPTALSDADPASDVLLSQRVFFPYSGTSRPLMKALDAVTLAAGRAGIPIKVAIISSAGDLGSVTELWGTPQRYATFLASEISFNTRQPLLVVMPSGFGTVNVSHAEALRGVAIDGSHGSDGLTRAAIVAVRRLAAAGGHPLSDPLVGGSGSFPLLIVGLALALVAIAALILLLRRRSGSRGGGGAGSAGSGSAGASVAARSSLAALGELLGLVMVVALVMTGCGSSGGTAGSSGGSSAAGGSGPGAGGGATPRQVARLALPANPTARSVRVPILTYHRVHLFATEYRKSIPDETVEPAVFAAEIDALARGGYHTVSQAQLFGALFGGARLPARPVLLTVDDGYVDDVRQILPVLRRHHMVATFYVITGRFHEQGFLNEAQVRRLDAAGMDVGAHTVTHASLPALSSAEARNQIEGSRRTLQRILGHFVYFFAYPYGANSPSVVSQVRRAGFVLAVTTQAGTHESSLAPLTMPRIHVGRSATPQSILACMRAAAGSGCGGGS